MKKNGDILPVLYGWKVIEVTVGVVMIIFVFMLVCSILLYIN